MADASAQPGHLAARAGRTPADSVPPRDVPPPPRDVPPPREAASQLAELARRVAASLDLQETLQLVADAVVEHLGFRAVAVNIVRPGDIYEVVAVSGPDDIDVLLGQTAAGSTYAEMLDAAEPWGDLRFYGHQSEFPFDLPSWVSPALEFIDGPSAWHPDDTLLAPLRAPDGALIGLLSVDGPAGGQLPSLPQRELLEQFAVHAALAIEHARVYTLLASSEQLFRAMFDHSPIAVALLADDGRIARVNAAFERLLGRRADELAGREPTDFTSSAEPLSTTARPPGTQEIRFARPDGSEVWGRVNTTRLPADAVMGPGRILTQIEDITQLRLAQSRLAHAATHDRLTGLPNRSLVMDRLAEALAGSGDDGSPVAVLFCDLDHFKQINDTLGHAAGDQLLVEVARRLQLAIRETDTVGRLGGDEFIVIARPVPAVLEVAAIVSRVTEAICQPVELYGEPILLSMSVGVALASEADDADALLAAADAALYQAKDRGRGCWQLASRKLPRCLLPRVRASWRRPGQPPVSGLDGGIGHEYIDPMTSEVGEVTGRPATGRLGLAVDQAVDQAGELAAALADGARAQHAEGDLQASRESFERAYRLAEQAGDVPSMALAALGLAGLWVRERRTVTGAVLIEERLQHVLARLDPDDPLALRIRARLAGEADYFRGEHAAILAVLDEARAAAGAVPLAEALSIAHHCLLGPDHVQLRRQLAVELTKVSVRTGRRGDLLMGLLWQTVDSYSAGEPHAGRLLTELRDHLDERSHLAAGFVVSAIDVMLAIRAGHLTEAESLAARCARSGAAAGDVDSEWWAAAQLVTIRWYQGRLVELLPLLRDRAHSPMLSAVDNSSAAALAVAAALAGDRHTAASSLAALSGRDLARLPRSSSWLVTMNGIVEAACLLQDAGLAEQAYQLLRPYASLPMVGGLGVSCFGSAHQALGVASLTSGQLDRAVDHLRAAVQHNLALAHWPAVVASRQRLAQAYELRRGPADAAAARRELETATSEATARGLPGAPVPVAECRRVGRNWRLAWGQRSVLVEDSIGMVHLAVLIANPRQEIPAAELVTGLAALGSAAGAGAAPHPVLDHEAIGEYRNRLKRLDAEIDRHDAADDPDQAARARAERDWLVAQLTSAAGLGGRTRSFPDQGERARVAVGKAIRRALARITEADPALGEHLRQSVHTGLRCSYWPG